MGNVIQFPKCGTKYNPANGKYWDIYCGELDAKQIERIVLSVSGYELQSLRRQNRRAEYVDARQLFVLLCIRHTKFSYPTIGKILARDHSSIMHLEKRKVSTQLRAMLRKSRGIIKYLHYNPAF